MPINRSRSRLLRLRTEAEIRQRVCRECSGDRGHPLHHYTHALLLGATPLDPQPVHYSVSWNPGVHAITLDANDWQELDANATSLVNARKREGQARLVVVENDVWVPRALLPDCRETAYEHYRTSQLPLHGGGPNVAFRVITLEAASSITSVPLRGSREQVDLAFDAPYLCEAV